MGNITNSTPYNSFLARALDTPSPIQMIADTSGMQNSPLFYIISMLNKGKSKSWNYPQKDSARMGNRSILRTITSVSQSGNNLIVNYAATGGVDPFRQNWTVLDANLKVGRVISHSLGQVTIEPDGAALSSSTDFQANTYIKNGWNESANRESTRTEDLTYFPDKDYNYAAVSRNTKYIDLEDQIHTIPQIYGKDLYYSQEKFGIEDWVKQLSIRWLIEQRAQVQGYDGMRNKNGGIFWGIQNRGGSMNQGTAPFTIADLRRVIETIRSKDQTPNINIASFLGTKVMGALQQDIGNDIKYSGQNNTFGGAEVKGINVKKYEYLDVSISFMPMPEFNNPLGIFADPCSYNPGSTVGQNSALFFNTADVTGVDGQTVPPIEIFHRGSRPVYYKHIPGMIEDDGTKAEIMDLENPESTLTVSDKPGRTALMYTWSGIDTQDTKGFYYWKG